MEKKFIRVDEVARVLEISESHAYKLMRKLNRELEEKGYIDPLSYQMWQKLLGNCYGIGS